MIDIGKYESCVCQGNGNPDKLCSDKLSFREKGKQVRLTVKAGEEARALVIDQCICADKNPKCDGMFLLRKQNHHYIILIELKGSHIEDAFNQLSYMRYNREEYKELESLFMQDQKGKPNHLSFIVSNHKLNKGELQIL